MFVMHSLKGRARRRGMIAVAVAVCLVVMFGVVAIALDGGGLLAERRHAQATADAAALAAACDLYDNYWLNNGADPNGTARASALKTAASNGYANDGTTSIVNVNMPPTSGLYAGRSGYVEVVVQFNQTRAFSNIFSSGPIPVRARAVALGAAVAANVGILVLDPTGKGAFNAQGGGSSTVTSTPIVVNSNHPEAAIAGGGGSVAAPDGVVNAAGTVVGTYLHGLFANDGLRAALLGFLAERKGTAVDPRWGARRPDPYGRLADAVARAVDLPAVAKLVGLSFPRS